MLHRTIAADTRVSYSHYFFGENLMIAVPDYVTNATKSSLEGQIDAMTAFGRKMIASLEKIAALNMSISKEMLAQSTAITLQMINSKGPQELMKITADHAKPNADKAATYRRELAEIAVAAKADFSQEAEAHLAETRRRVSSFIDDAGKNAPASAEPMVKIVKSVIGTADAGFDQFSKTAKQANNAFDTHVEKAVSKFNQATEKMTGRAAGK
jgi:phasin family protein